MHKKRCKYAKIDVIGVQKTAKKELEIENCKKRKMLRTTDRKIVKMQVWINNKTNY